MTEIHLDVLGGVAGDMFLAALVDARPDLAGVVEAALRDAGLPEAVAARFEPVRVHGLTGQRFALSVEGEAPDPPRRMDGIAALLRESRLSGPVRDRALAIFRLLAVAEGEVHGVAPEAVTFHEVADWDSIADIAAAAAVIEALGAARWTAGPLPQGGGRVATRHGVMPVPAPATALLLRGFELVDDGIAGERITPTGAAILAHLAPAQGGGGFGGAGGGTARRLRAAGTGFGTRKLPGLPNILRALVFEDAAAAEAGEGAGAVRRDRVGVLAFEIDDQTAEDLAIALGRLREMPGVLEAFQAPAYGKKGRLATRVEILCLPAALEAVAAACLNETTTLGLRLRVEERRVLARHELAVSAADDAAGGMAGAPVAVKLATRPDGRRTAKAAADDTAGGDAAARRAQRRAAEAAALDREEDS